jgi:hypothetical protein
MHHAAPGRDGSNLSSCIVRGPGREAIHTNTLSSATAASLLQVWIVIARSTAGESHRPEPETQPWAQILQPRHPQSFSPPPLGQRSQLQALEAR